MEKCFRILIKNKTIQITEKAYKAIQEYQAELNLYFSDDKDGKEIMEDIEIRMEEILLDFISNPDDVIDMDAIGKLKKKLGTIDDFKNQEDKSDNHQAQQHESKKSTKHKLYRDKNSGIIAGVCEGLGNHFAIDPIWIRILFIFGSIMFFGSFAVIYVLLWIFVPEREHQDIAYQYKKIYRDADNAFIAGVCSGIAKYLGIKVEVIRGLFLFGFLILPILHTFSVMPWVFFFPFGLVLSPSFILVYIILWIIIPVAKTRLDKMRMQGKSTTISDIEDWIKKKKNNHESIDKLLDGSNRVLKILVHILKRILELAFLILRIILGFTIMLISSILFLIMFILTLNIAISTPIALSEMWDIPQELIDWINNDILLLDFYTWFSVFFSITLINYFLFIAGLTLLSLKNYFNKYNLYVLLIIFGLLVVSIAFNISALPSLLPVFTP